ncbi:unnamed protein product [Rotaria sordida]|uniref:Uncharacterized protein n=1 Tax=Rotaria sordida TaxID=392033 RepID=A0A814CFA0_9BILA|nr:unnamed protein product [Rotaria sordida]CAF0986056.1 unnamed protein product [Rotaria sordida]
MSHKNPGTKSPAQSNKSGLKDCRDVELTFLNKANEIYSTLSSACRRANIIKELFKSIYDDFKQTYPKHNDVIGFESWFIDSKGNICGITRDIHLFTYLCNAKKIPRKLLNTSVPNTLSTDDFRRQIEDKYKSIYSIGELACTNNERLRHLRIDLLNLIKYKQLLNTGVICIEHLYLHVYEYLAAPRVIFCSTSNLSGHNKKRYQHTFEQCKRNSTRSYYRQNGGKILSNQRSYSQCQQQQYINLNQIYYDGNRDWSSFAPSISNTTTYIKPQRQYQNRPGQIKDIQIQMNKLERECQNAKNEFDRKNLEIITKFNTSIAQIQPLIICFTTIIQRQNEMILVLKTAVNECLKLKKITNHVTCSLLNKNDGYQ